MISLFIDTSNSDVSIAVVRDNEILANICESIPNMHSVYVVPYLDKVIKDSGIKFQDIINIMVVNGPGSFTGIRIGLTVAKIMGYCLNRDIIPVSSLKALALSVNNDHVLSLIDARNDNYYMGLYDKYRNEIVKEHFANIEEIKELMLEYSDAILVSNDELEIDKRKCSKVNYDILNIVNFYKNVEAVNAHVVNSNYLKLPQAVSDYSGK